MRGPAAHVVISPRPGRTALVQLLAEDTSALALCPGDPARLERLLGNVSDLMEKAMAGGTAQGDVYHFRAWERVCKDLGTSPWRVDAAANSGLDPVGHRRELLLLAIALVLMYAAMKPRSKKDPVANPRSALQKLRGVARVHKARGHSMAPLTYAVQAMKGMLRAAVAIHDTDWLAPSRKRPLTNAMVLAILSVGDGLSGMGFEVDLTTYMWISVVATFAVLAETGMRKADVSKPLASTPFTRGRLTFASLKWVIDGRELAFLTIAQLQGARVGYACYLVFGALKNDPFAEFYGSRPVRMDWAPGPAPNACRALVALELAARVAPGKRATTPLFGPRPGVEWHHSLLDKIFKFLLVHACGLDADEAKGFSVHSFRIYLACALYAAGCPNDRIQAILRWKSEEALLIYARLNDSERGMWIARARGSLVDSRVAAHLPTVDGDAIAARLLEDDVDTMAREEEA